MSVVNNIMGTGQEINIAAIVEQCRQGDMDALRVLYVSYYTNLLSILVECRNVECRNVHTFHINGII